MMEPHSVSVLLVEDNLADARLVKQLLRETGEAIALTHAGDLSQAIGYLKQQGFNAMLLDLGLPDSEGLATFTRAHAEAPDAPIVVLTGLHDEDLAVKALREGAQDYLVKGQVDGRLLYHAIRYAIERHRVEDALRESEQRFRELADNVREVFFVADPETGQALYLSPAYEEVFGRSREHAYAERSHWLEAVHPEDRERLLAEILATVRGAEPGSELFRVV